MSSAPSGITYALKFDTARLGTDLAAAESKVVAHVAKLNALKVVIPTTLDLSKFTTQAATIDATLAKWAAGVNIPVNIGGGGGGLGTSIVNNTSINNSVTNLNNTVTNAVTNLLNTINNTVSNVVNNTTGGGGGRGGGGGMRGLGRFLAPYAFIREAEQLVRNEGAYREAMDAANTQQDEIKAQIKHRTSYDSFAFGIGRLGRAVREDIVAPITGATTTADLEHEEQDTKRQEEKAQRMEESLRFARTVGREFRVATSGEGYLREQQEIREAKTADDLRVSEQRNKDAAPIQAAYEKRMGDIRAKQEQEKNVGLNSGLAQMGLTEWTDEAGNKRLVKWTDLEAEAKADRDKLISPIDQRATEQRAQFEQVNRVKIEQANRRADEHRDVSLSEARESAAVLGGSSRTEAEATARAERDAINAAKYDRTLRPDDAAAAKAADAVKTALANEEARRRQVVDYGELDVHTQAAQLRLAGRTDEAHRIERDAGAGLREGAEMDTTRRGKMKAADAAAAAEDEDRMRRDRERKDADSEQRITATHAEAEDARLRLAGRMQEAELAGFDAHQQARIVKMEEAVLAERDVRERGHRQAELDAERAAQGEERSEFVKEQARQEKIQEDASNLRVVASAQKAAELQLRGRNQTFAAGQAAFEHGWDQRIYAAIDARDNAKSNADRQRREAELNALYDEHGAAMDEREAGRARQVQYRADDNNELRLRNEGRRGTAGLVKIIRDANRELEQETGNPNMQREILRGEREEIIAMARRGEGQKGEAVGRIGQADLTNAYGPRNNDRDLRQAMVNALQNIDRKLENKGLAVTGK